MDQKDVNYGQIQSSDQDDTSLAGVCPGWSNDCQAFWHIPAVSGRGLWEGISSTTASLPTN